jgi:hypothetical protein
MSEQNDWDVIRRAGIQIDFHAEPLPGWGYAIPVVGCDWHGPYSTKTEALEAALRYLLDRVRKEPVLNRTRSTVDSTLLHSGRLRICSSGIDCCDGNLVHLVGKLSYFVIRCRKRLLLG